MESKDFLAAHEGFNNAIRVDPKHADVSIIHSPLNAKS